MAWDRPYAKWYRGGRLNVCFNCVDRHVEAGNGARVAFHWEGEPEGDRREITYAELQRDVVRFANVLKEIGVRKGTPVAIYMGMVPELPIAMLACTRLGAPHTVVFGGFSADSLSSRMNDMECEVLITQDAGWRKGGEVPLKKTADAAMADAPGVRRCLVVHRKDADVDMQEARDVWYHELADSVSDDPESSLREPMDSEDLLFLMYTSGTTAKPKGIVHTTAGYLVGVATTHYYISTSPEQDVYLVRRRHRLDNGHSYIVYGPLCERRNERPVRGHAGLPGQGSLVGHRRALRRHDPLHRADGHPFPHEVGRRVRRPARSVKLRLLGSVGELINPEAWVWYREHIGSARTPVVDTWWQTETGMILITPLPGVTTLKPGSATKPFPGVEAAVYDQRGNEVGPGGGGYLVLRKPWPAMLRGIFKDDQRYRETYWSKYGEVYFAGDGASRSRRATSGHGPGR